MILPTQKTVVETDLSKYTIFIYGREKIGKTSLAAQFPDALFLMCEPGGKAQSIYKIDVNSWADFVEAIKILQTSKQFKTVIIDTVDLAFKFCEDFMCKKMAIDHPSDEAYGKGYTLIKDEFHRRISVLEKLNRGVIFLSHAKSQEVKKLKGDTFTISPTLGKQGKSILIPMIDIYGCYDYDGANRTLRIRGTEEVDAGCRLDRNFVGISTIDMGSSPEAGYQNFMKAFNTTKGEDAPVPVKSKIVVRRT